MIMNITINGSQKQLKENATLEDIVRELCQNPKHVIAELNGAIVDSAHRPNTKVKEGDRLELVSFVGGG